MVYVQCIFHRFLVYIDLYVPYVLGKFGKRIHEGVLGLSAAKG